MGYKDPDEQRKYQREWCAKRRLTWLQENGPCVDCGTWYDLEIDHVDAKQKITNSVWSWSLERRTKELSKCAVRCRPCHDVKTAAQQESARGSKVGSSKLREIDVKVIRQLHADGLRYRPIASIYNVDQSMIGYICRRVYWKHVL